MKQNDDVEIQKFEIEVKPQKVVKYPHTYYATKEEMANPKFRRASPKEGAYKNIQAWRKE